MARQKQILTNADLRSIQDNLRKLHDLIPLVQKAENCGMDCDKLREQMELTAARLEAFRREFFPNQQE